MLNRNECVTDRKNRKTSNVCIQVQKKSIEKSMPFSHNRKTDDRWGFLIIVFLNELRIGMAHTTHVAYCFWNIQLQFTSVQPILKLFVLDPILVFYILNNVENNIQK